MADPLSNLRAAYAVLETRVNLALRTQLGDTAQLRLQRDEAFRLLEAAEPVSRHICQLMLFSPSYSTDSSFHMPNLLLSSRASPPWLLHGNRKEI
jgi:hypothetical protein